MNLFFILFEIITYIYYISFLEGIEQTFIKSNIFKYCDYSNYNEYF